MSMFAVVHRPAELTRACEEISEFLSFHRKKQPSARYDPLVGIWRDSTISEEVAANLDEEAPTIAGGLGKIRESTSLGGVWTLCWLHSESVSRLSVGKALLQLSSSKTEDVLEGKFTPVFPVDMSDSEIEYELYTLQCRLPSRVMPPLWQERQTGKILLPPNSVT